MRVPEQVSRIAVVVAVVLVGAVALRFFIIPQSYFSTALHRSSTVKREAARAVHYAGAQACRECHQEQFDAKAVGNHKNLGCETCHGPSAAHAEDPSSVKPEAPRDRKFCPVCHAYDPSRPTGFPQINPTSHNPLKPCVSCHNPHAPVPPQTPEQCSACHGQIARTKAQSSHALLECTVCHTVSEEHKKNPRSALPSIPQARDFCGRCHGQAAGESSAPKIDMATHGGSYLCWQCHYPHLPEAH
ncbi:MAG: hypothetical protein HZB25_04895 [Candidatus Eisenbacteria bacterium]|nr:hypothetical protein [Candidatus Eisenbacteria bacterium]